MTFRPIAILDESQVEIARLDVAHQADHYEGSIDLASTPPAIYRVFERYEQIVEGQMFSLLDDIEDEIQALRLRIAFDDGMNTCVEDFQVFPSRRTVSFTIRLPARAS